MTPEMPKKGYINKAFDYSSSSAFGFSSTGGGGV